MHCHTSEGSIDSKVGMIEYAHQLKRMGFGGMLVSDHDSFEGYYYYKNHSQDEELKDFVVLRGIEYDTFEYGHVLVILPTDAPVELLQLLEKKGLFLWRLIDVVHFFGGILGPAHPGGEKFLSFVASKHRKIVERAMHLLNFDFVEGYNACEDDKSNAIAYQLARNNHLPVIAGSDAHSYDCVGLGYVYLPKTIQTEDDLIAYMKQKPNNRIGGSRYGKTTKDKLGRVNKILVYSFFLYNKLGALCAWPKRHKLIKQLKNNSYRKSMKKSIDNPKDSAIIKPIKQVGKQKN